MSVGSSKDIQVFTGVMDGDTERRRIAPGDYLYLLNARSTITNEQNNSAIEDCEGNMLVGNPYVNMYGGESKCIGSYEDVAGQSIIYFVYNSLGHHGIYRWFLNRPGYPEGVVEKIWQVKDPSIYNEYNKNPLNFHPDYLITGVALVDNLLLWTDYYNEPRQMDIVRANETNKKRKFDFYLNQEQLTLTSSYTLTLIDESLLVPIFGSQMFISDKSILVDRVEDIVNQINILTGIGYTAVNKTDHIELELENPEEYLISIGDPLVGRILANNFYYYNIPGNYFNRIQPPPFCCPSAKYIPSGPPTEVAEVRAILNTLDNEDTGWTNEGLLPFQSAQAKYWVIGVASDLNDLNGNIEIGNTVTFQANWNGYSFPGLTYSQVQGFVHTENGSLTLKYSFHLDCNFSNIVVQVNLPQNPNFIYVILPSLCYVALRKISPSGVTSILHSVSVPLVSNPINFNFTSPDINVNLLAGDKVYLTVDGRGLQSLNFNLGQFSLGSVVIGNSEAVIMKQTKMFRHKYIYENFQRSVYGQSTSVVLRTEAYRNQHEIEILFNDKFISSDAYCSRIKEIRFSLTEDGGTTWYDYDTLKPYQFVPIGSTKAIYDGKSINVPVDTAAAILQFHAVPLREKSLSYIDDRLVTGGIVEGYDSINIDLDITYWAEDYVNNSFYASGVLPISVEGWKPGYSGYIGIVYYDDYDRKTSVCLSTNSKIKIPYYPIPLTAGLPFNAVMPVWNVLIDVYNAPPDWATKYRLVRTKDFSQTDYLMWVIDSVEIINQDGTTGGVAKYWKIGLDNIPYYTEKAQRGTVINYTFVAGDRFRLITNQAGDVFTTIFDFEIKSAESNSIYIDYDPLLTITSGCLIEIYSKGEEQSADNALFYEMGECMEVKVGIFDGIRRKYHSGNNPMATNIDQTYQFPDIITPAKLITRHGGVYNRIRTMYYDTLEPVIVDLPYWINSNLCDEFDQSKEDGLSRPNGVLRLGELSRPTTSRFTNRYLSGSEINGLNENEPLNEVTLNRDYGLMSKFIVTNNDILKIIFANSYQMSLYISQGVIRQLQGVDKLIAVTDNVLQNSHIIQRTVGGRNPESVAINDEADVIGYDENEGVVWRSSGNGVVYVSDYKQKNNFKKWGGRRKVLDRERSQSPAIYDLYHDEYILTLSELSPSPEKRPTAILDIPDIYASDTFSPGGPTGLQFTVQIKITNPTNIILPVTQVQAGASLHAAIIAAFSSVGWLATINIINGKIHLTAPSVIDFNNRDIIITIVTNQGESLGPEMVRNGQFIAPNQLGDWQIPGDGSWTLNPISSINQWARHNAGISTNPLFQENLGFVAGKKYRIGYSIAVAIPNTGTIRPVLGVTTPVNGTLQYASATEFTEDFIYLDTANDRLSFEPTLNFLVNVFNVTCKEVIPESTFTFRYQITNGVIAQTGETFPAVTIAFSKKKNGWPQYHSFTPEMYGRLNDNVVSFRDGQLWLHTTKAIPKNYYGVQYGRELIFVSNKDFPKVKEYKALSVNGIGKNAAPIIRIPPYEGVPNGMETELTQAHFETKEGVQYAAIQRDKLTPGAASTDEGWVNGRAMKGQVIEVKLVNNDPDVSLIFNAEILYFYSENS